MEQSEALPKLKLTAAEKKRLVDLTRQSQTAPALALRARIVLACAAGYSNAEVARRLNLLPHKVGRWRARFVAKRVHGLVDMPRTRLIARVAISQLETLFAKTLREKPVDAPHWSTRRMAKATGLSQTTVFRIWKAVGPQPIPAAPAMLPTGGVRGCTTLCRLPAIRATPARANSKNHVQVGERSCYSPAPDPGAISRSAPDIPATPITRTLWPMHRRANADRSALVALRGLQHRRRDTRRR
jgi:hypothetical protein